MSVPAGPLGAAWSDHAIYALAWLSFGAGHSLLAHPPVRRAVARLVGSGERLTYNAVASLHILAVLVLGQWLYADAAGFALAPWASAALWALAALGLLILAAALREYDLGRFAGTWQLRHGAGPDTDAADEPLVTAGLHRYVRHPLYAGGLALLWGLAQSPFGLATALFGSLYLWIGAAFEERKLLRQYGDAYRAYRQSVPAVLPWKGRAI